MPTVTMPQLGESVAEGTIGKWLKKVGDHVDLNEPIVEVITDKVNAEVPSPFAGTLTEILVSEGEIVANDAAIAIVETAGMIVATAGVGDATAGVAAPATVPTAVATKGPTTATSSPAEPVRQAPPTPTPTPMPTSGNGSAPVTDGSAAASAAASAASAAAMAPYTGRTTPAVRRLAREHGVDLSRVSGSGHGGRVTRDDVMRHVGTVAATAPPTPVAVPVSPVAEGDSLKALNPMRKAIAAHMTRSLSVPVAYVTVEVDMTAVVRRREQVKRDYEAREGMSLSYVAFVTQATVKALRRHPDLNAHWTDEGHWRRRAVNVGIAVAVEDGLVVPVIRDADTLSLHELNVAINDLAGRARSSKLRMEDISGGTFTVDNTGWTGSVLTLPIINVPEVAILTMEKVVKRPVVIEGPDGDSIAIRSMMNMCIGIDHRATDGAQAGAFLADLRRWLETVNAQTPIR